MEKYDLKFRYLKQNKAIKCRRTKNGKLSGEKTDETIVILVSKLADALKVDVSLFNMVCKGSSTETLCCRGTLFHNKQYHLLIHFIRVSKQILKLYKIFYSYN